MLKSLHLLLQLISNQGFSLTFACRGSEIELTRSEIWGQHTLFVDATAGIQLYTPQEADYC